MSFPLDSFPSADTTSTPRPKQVIFSLHNSGRAPPDHRLTFRLHHLGLRPSPGCPRLSSQGRNHNCSGTSLGDWEENAMLANISALDSQVPRIIAGGFIASPEIVMNRIRKPELTPAESRFCEIIGNSPALESALAEMEQVAPTDSTVLVLGETGTGKELI